ncbi:MAG: DUF2341 domain-containing protein, partial [Candidatus Micrarchaeota archaeon]
MRKTSALQAVIPVLLLLAYALLAIAPFVNAPAFGALQEELRSITLLSNEGVGISGVTYATQRIYPNATGGGAGYVYYDGMAATYGRVQNGASLYTPYDATSNYKLFFDFNLSNADGKGIPTGATINSANLNYYVSSFPADCNNGGITADSMGLRFNTSSFPSDVTLYENITNTTARKAYVNGTAVTTTGWVNVSLGSAAQSDVQTAVSGGNNQPNITIGVWGACLYLTTPAVMTVTGSTGTAANRPFLEIAYTVGNNAPDYSQNSTNSTNAGEAINFSLKWNATAGLSANVFSLDNGNGSFINESPVGMTGTENWSNRTMTANSTFGSIIRWKVWANNTNNEGATSATYQFTAQDIIVLNLTASKTTPAAGESIYLWGTARFRNGLNITNQAALFYRNGTPITPAGFYNATWFKRKTINASVGGESNLTNYQVLVNVTYEPEMNADFSDLFFTQLAANGTEIALPFFTENKSDSKYAMAWFKALLLPNNTNATVYAYYGGGAGAPNVSNHANTMMFYDGFDGGSLGSRWQYYTGVSGIVSVANGFLRVEDSNGDSPYARTEFANSTTPFVVEANVTNHNLSYNVVHVTTNGSTQGPAGLTDYGAGLEQTGCGNCFRWDGAYANPAAAGSNYSYAIYVNGTSHNFTARHPNGTVAASSAKAVTPTQSQVNSIYASCSSGTVGCGMRIKYVRVRQYTRETVNWSTGSPQTNPAYTNVNGTFNVSITLNTPGAYNISANVSANETTGHNYTVIIVSAETAAQAPNYSALANSTPAVYALNGTAWLNATWTDNLAVSQALIEFDGVNYTPTKDGNVYYLLFNSLAAGPHSWVSYANDTSGNFNATGNNTFTIAKAPVLARVYANGSSTNRTRPQPNVYNFTATKNVSQGTIELLYNNTGHNMRLNDSTLNTTYITWAQNNATGHFITARYNETQNYSASAQAIQITTMPFAYGTLRLYTNYTGAGDGYSYVEMGSYYKTQVGTSLYLGYSGDASYKPFFDFNFSNASGTGLPQGAAIYSANLLVKVETAPTYCNEIDFIGLLKNTSDFTNTHLYGNISNTLDRSYVNATVISTTGFKNITLGSAAAADIEAAMYTSAQNFTVGLGLATCSDPWSASAGTITSTRNDTAANRPYLEVTYGKADDSAPQYSNVATNSTNAGEAIKFSMKWISSAGLSTYIFSLDNGNGSFINESSAVLTGTEAWSNRTQNVNTSANTNVSWRMWVNNSNNAGATSGIYQFTTVSADNDAPYYFNTANSSPTIYAQSQATWINVTWLDKNSSSISVVLFEIDGANYTPLQDPGNSSIYFRKYESLAAGYHYLKAYANDTGGRANATGNYTLNITRAPTLATLTANNSPNNQTTVGLPNTTNLTATKNNSQGTLELNWNHTGTYYNINTTGAYSTNTTSFQWTQNNASGYLVTARYNETQNYTTANASLQITYTTDPNPPNHTNNATSYPASYAPNTPTWINVTWTDNVAINHSY